MTRRLFIVGNFKLNGTENTMKALVRNFNKAHLPTTADVVIAPPLVYLGMVRKILRKDINVAGQNCYTQISGAFTGEVSPEMLKDIGASWVILGHAERRKFFSESNDFISEKIALAMKTGLYVIAFIGENLEDRLSNQIHQVLFQQLESISKSVTDWSRIVIAYESIGNDKVFKPFQAQKTHDWIRTWLRSHVGNQVADETRIIYGGWVTEENAKSLYREKDIDGFLVGAASLRPEFMTIWKAQKK